MDALDELEEEDEEQEVEEQEKKKGNIHEFSLPLEDYEQLISEHRQDDQSISSVHEESTSPTLPPAKRTRTKRDSSPANSVADSVTSTPEPDENKSARRTSRGTRKSEATPEPNLRSSGRRAGRSSSTTSTVTRGNKRQTSKRK
ncbi:uncharacterized protein BX663DRAFT_518308 [Cokeromyces recurvatus]|uniref:uncharacterized protein n=1 Tax=Cokeromyces recurvatus TaxID=90255 RepID=UPI00221E991B|nr:uncharacterized protein BX663DRAFT_518308 [Cokeromyces recurvatus]KAI7900336.1 hypothetical protein BX663DRAFT_518308 [Cokeromyces recurvatus]